MISINQGCSCLVNHFAFHPDTVNVMDAEALPHGLTEVSITASDGVTLNLLHLPNDQSDKLLLYFHGNARNIYRRMPSLLRLQKEGLNVVALSYRGFGKSGGSPSEKGIYIDGQTALDFVRKELSIPKQNIYILGRSLGSTVALEVAQGKKMGGIILVSPFTSAREHAKTGNLKYLAPLAGNAFNNVEKIKLQKSPVLIIHGTRDSVTPYSMGVKLFEEGKPPKQMMTFENASHSDLQDIYADRYFSGIRDFIFQLPEKN